MGSLGAAPVTWHPMGSAKVLAGLPYHWVPPSHPQVHAQALGPCCAPCFRGEVGTF